MKEFEGDFEDLGLCFDVTTSKALGTATSIPLIRNGSSTPVTRQNRMEYILRLAHYKLNESARQSRISKRIKRDHT